MEVDIIVELFGFIRVYAISQKSEVLSKFHECQAWLERTCDCSMKCLMSDGGGEYQVLKPYHCQGKLNGKSVSHTRWNRMG